MNAIIHGTIFGGSHVLLAAGFMLLASCGNQSGASGGSQQAQAGQRIKSGDLFDDDSLKLADKYGTVNPLYAGKQGKRLEEAGKVNRQFTGEFGKSDYRAKSYEKKPFWGTKGYSKKVYGGSTDGSRFLQSAREASQGHRDAGRRYGASDRRYDRGRDIDGNAREGSRPEVRRVTDAETEHRRRVFTEPEIRRAGKKRALSVKETRSLLGR